MLGIILAGGKSQRFGGDGARPKPTVEVNGAPMVLHTALKLAREGVGRICVLTGRNHAAIRKALGMSGDKGTLVAGPGVSVPLELRFSGDDAGSAGRLTALARSEFGGGALLSYTDVFTDASLSGLVDAVRDQACDLGLLTVSPRLPWGIVRSAGSVVTAFEEKPVVPSLAINAGFFFCAGAILDHIRHPSEMLEGEPMASMIATGKVCSVHHAGDWMCLDSPKDVALVEAEQNRLFRPDIAPSVRQG